MRTTYLLIVALLFVSVSTADADEYDWPTEPTRTYVLYFKSKNCEPCQRIDLELPKLNENWSIKRYRGFKDETKQAHVIVVDVDVYPEVADRWKVDSIPTFVRIRANRETNRMVGFHSANQIAQFYNGILRQSVFLPQKTRTFKVVREAPVVVESWPVRVAEVRPAVVRQTGPTWTWPGSISAGPNKYNALASHLAAEHGYSVAWLNSLSPAELVALHDNTHNTTVQRSVRATVMSPTYATPTVQTRGRFSYSQGVHAFGVPLFGTYSAGSGNAQFCPNGVCPR